MPISGEAIEGLPEEILEYYGDDPELRKLMEEKLKEHLAQYGHEDAAVQMSGLPPAE